MTICQIIGSIGRIHKGLRNSLTTPNNCHSVAQLMRMCSSPSVVSRNNVLPSIVNPNKNDHNNARLHKYDVQCKDPSRSLSSHSNSPSVVLILITGIGDGKILTGNRPIC